MHAVSALRFLQLLLELHRINCLTDQFFLDSVSPAWHFSDPLKCKQRDGVVETVNSEATRNVQLRMRAANSVSAWTWVQKRSNISHGCQMGNMNKPQFRPTECKFNVKARSWIASCRGFYSFGRNASTECRAEVFHRGIISVHLSMAHEGARLICDWSVTLFSDQLAWHSRWKNVHKYARGITVIPILKLWSPLANCDHKQHHCALRAPLHWSLCNVYRNPADTLPLAAGLNAVEINNHLLHDADSPLTDMDLSLWNGHFITLPKILLPNP